MNDDDLILEGVIVRHLTTTQSRRRVLGRVIGGAGLLAASAGGLSVAAATARKDDDDGDDSGGDDGDDDHSGHGNGSDDGGDDRDSGDGGDDDAPVITGEIPTGTIEVRIVDDDASGFSPGDVIIDLGQTVTFINADDDEHSATGGGFDTSTIAPGGTATVTFDAAGAFPFACQFHPVMTGTVRVRDANGTVPTQAAASTPTAGATEVRIIDFAFTPATSTVAAGTTIVWANDDAAPHTVTALDGAFESGVFDPGASFSWTFPDPGSFAYRCDLHPTMQGTVEVTGDAAIADDPTSEAATAAPLARGITGTWVATLTPTVVTVLPALRSLLTFHTDGTLSAILALDGDVEGGIAASGPAAGAWADAGTGGTRWTAVAFLLDADGRFTGTLALGGEGQIDVAGDAFASTYRFDATDADGQVIGSGGGECAGERVRVG